MASGWNTRLECQLLLQGGKACDRLFFKKKLVANEMRICLSVNDGGDTDVDRVAN